MRIRQPSSLMGLMPAQEHIAYPVFTSGNLVWQAMNARSVRNELLVNRIGTSLLLAIPTILLLSTPLGILFLVSGIWLARYCSVRVIDKVEFDNHTQEIYCINWAGRILTKVSYRRVREVRLNTSKQGHTYRLLAAPGFPVFYFHPRSKQEAEWLGFLHSTGLEVVDL